MGSIDELDDACRDIAREMAEAVDGDQEKNLVKISRYRSK